MLPHARDNHESIPPTQHTHTRSSSACALSGRRHRLHFMLEAPSPLISVLHRDTVTTSIHAYPSRMHHTRPPIKRRELKGNARQTRLRRSRRPSPQPTSVLDTSGRRCSRGPVSAGRSVTKARSADGMASSAPRQHTYTAGRNLRHSV